MSKKSGNTTSDHRLADWYEESGLARFTDTLEFRAKGSIEMSHTHRKEMFGTFCSIDTIRIVSCSGVGRYWIDVGYGRHQREVHSNAPYTLVLPANAEVTVHVPYQHSNRSLSLHPAVLEAHMHVPAERIVAAFERLSDHCFAESCLSNLTSEIWHNGAEETGWLGEFFCDNASLALVAYLLREELRFDQQVKKGGLSPRPMRMLIEFMASRLSDKLRISELAGIAGLSEYHFIRAFRRETGETPYQYVLRMRINRASELLRQHPYKSVNEIALLCGFGSASTLALQFRRQTGMSPRSYRNRL
jgi:AraC-like DNA-binding protein